MTVRVFSPLTGQMEICSVAKGIVGYDGTVVGAIPDIECLHMFEWEGDMSAVDTWLGNVRAGETGYDRTVNTLAPMNNPSSPERMARVDAMCERADRFEPLFS